MSDGTTGATGTGRSPLPIVRMRGVTKRFGDVVANDAIDLDLYPGEILGLLGENGAGKTTLMKILFGLSGPDAGTIEVDGQARDITAPSDAIAAGIGMVTQHFSLVAPMTVTENVVLGATQGFVVDRRRARARVAAVADEVGIDVDPDARVADLSVGERQRVEILKALYRDCRVLILDEPTAVLIPQEVASLFATIRRLTARGLAVVFISHKLNEVREICDRVTVLRRGELVDTVPTATVDNRELARLMVGRPTFGVSGDDRSPRGDVVLHVRDLDVTGANGLPAVRDLALDVHEAEILGVAGVSGNGQSELVDVLTGMRRPDGGVLRIGGFEISGGSPQLLMGAGVGRIPEDRHAAVVGDLTVAHNLVLEHLDDYCTGARIDERRIRAKADELIERFDIKARPTDRIATLSGGNMQKVILARVLDREPDVLVVAQPTRGLDIGATEYVRQQLLDQRARGCAILLFSEDLDELLTLSDRIAVMYEGRIVATLPVAEAEPERLGLLMAGTEAA